MRYSLDKVTDPFILQLIETFGVTGFWYRKDGNRYTVGQPTLEKKKETKRERRERWIVFKKRSGK